MTIYHLYAHNGDRTGFWVQHRSWANMCARVQTIGGQSKGRLAGTSPLYNNAEVIVSGFDVRSGRPVELGPVLPTPEDQRFTLIAQPKWYKGESTLQAVP